MEKKFAKYVDNHAKPGRVRVTNTIRMIPTHWRPEPQHGYRRNRAARMDWATPIWLALAFVAVLWTVFVTIQICTRNGEEEVASMEGQP